MYKYLVLFCLVPSVCSAFDVFAK